MKSSLRLVGRRGRRSAFTLVELLVVISIIGILAGLSAWGVMRARLSGQEGAVRANLASLEVAIEQYLTERGEYPPSSLGRWGLKSAASGTNLGIESLLASLQTKKRGGPFLIDLDPDQRSNTDGDTLTPVELKKLKKAIDWNRQNNILFEYCDIWGNPLVYIHSNDYSTTFKIKRTDGSEVEVRAVKDPETGSFYNPSSFQLFSLGEDEVQNADADGDDIWHWKR